MYSEGFPASLNLIRDIFQVASEATRNEWWQMAERRGPPTCWKNRSPASLQHARGGRAQVPAVTRQKVGVAMGLTLMRRKPPVSLESHLPAVSILAASSPCRQLPSAEVHGPQAAPEPARMSSTEEKPQPVQHNSAGTHRALRELRSAPS